MVTPEPYHFLNYNALDLVYLDVGNHPLKSGTIKISSQISVVLVIVMDGRITVITVIFSQNPLLVAIPIKRLLYQYSVRPHLLISLLYFTFVYSGTIVEPSVYTMFVMSYENCKSEKSVLNTIDQRWLTRLRYL